MAEIPDVSAIPPVAQAIATVVVGLGLGVAAVLRYLRQPMSKPNEDVVIQGASIADMRPIRQALEELIALRQTVDEIHNLMRRDASLKEMQRELRREASLEELAREADEAVRRRRREDDEDRDRRR